MAILKLEFGNGTEFEHEISNEFAWKLIGDMSKDELQKKEKKLK